MSCCLSKGVALQGGVAATPVSLVATILLFSVLGRMVHWFPLCSWVFPAAIIRPVVSIHIFTWQSWANVSLIHSYSVHANAFTPVTRIVATKLETFLPVQLGLREKLKIERKITRNLCTHILGSPTPIFCANCAGAPPHKFRTISAHFWMPPTKFSGTCRECPAHSFCTIFSGGWPVLKICLCAGNKCLNTKLVSVALHCATIFKGNFRHKTTTIIGNRGQLWTSTLSLHLLSPHLDFPDFLAPDCWGS